MLTMKMKKAEMVNEVLKVMKQGVELVARREFLIGVINNFSLVISEELKNEVKEIIPMSDSFPNFWFDDEAGLKKEKKVDLIKIYVLYLRGVQTVLNANIELDKMFDKVSKRDECKINTPIKQISTKTECHDCKHNCEDFQEKCDMNIGSRIWNCGGFTPTPEPKSIQKSVDANHVSTWRKSTLELEQKGLVGQKLLQGQELLQFVNTSKPEPRASEALFEGGINWEKLADELHGDNNVKRLLEDENFRNLYCHPIDKDCEECGNPFSIILAPNVTVENAEKLHTGIKVCKECDDKKFGIGQVSLYLGGFEL